MSPNNQGYALNSTIIAFYLEIVHKIEAASSCLFRSSPTIKLCTVRQVGHLLK